MPMGNQSEAAPAHLVNGDAGNLHSKVSVEYLEELPQGGGVCPPEKAEDIELEGAYRVIYNKPPTCDDFKSYHALGVSVRPGVDPCVWAACSLFLDGIKAKQIAGKLAKTREAKPILALINIPSGSGKSLVNERSLHVSFWMYKSFDFKSCIVDLEDIHVD